MPKTVMPGEMLKEEFLTEHGLSQNQLAKAVGISPNRIADAEPQPTRREAARQFVGGKA